MIVSTRNPCGGIYYTSCWPISLWQNPMGLMHFQKQRKLVREAFISLVIAMWNYAGFFSVLLCSLKVIPRWRSRVARPSNPFLLTCTFIKLRWWSWLRLWKRKLADTNKIFSYNHNDQFYQAINLFYMIQCLTSEFACVGGFQNHALRLQVYFECFIIRAYSRVGLVTWPFMALWFKPSWLVLHFLWHPRTPSLHFIS